MTHTNHRQGTVESLKGDWVVQMRAARGVNDQGSCLKLKKFLELSLKYNPVNGGSSIVGNALTVGWQQLIDVVGGNEKSASALVVFDDMAKLVGFLHELAQVDLGLSVIISGLHEETDRICREVGTRRHTVQHSLGVWGKTELLPSSKIQEVTVMCGHGTIPFNLVRRMAEAVRSGKVGLEKASKELAKPCICGIVNTTRAQALLQEYIAETEKGQRNN
ncbi:hypothetical protein ACFLXT_04840 [Chloroflexota bacterium]